ncbi:hypothetical protein ScPMuIL_018475 [Solemya velum]
MPACTAVNGAQFHTSEQHKKMSDARKVKDHQDMCKMWEYFQDYSPFQAFGEQLYNIATGVTASTSCNPHMAEDVGKAILSKMEGQNAFQYSFKKKEQIEPMGQTAVSIGREKVTVDPQLLFHRLLIVANSSDCDLEEVLKFELSVYPAALFAKNGLLRQASKPQLSEAIADLIPKENTDGEWVQAKYNVLDGESLIHRFPWKKDATFGDIVKTYVDYLKTFANLTVVFDGYASGPTTKDMTHRRRSHGMVGSNVLFRASMSLKSKKEHFLANTENKQNCIHFLCKRLEASNIENSKANGDADTLIAQTGVERAKFGVTHVIGEDTDILVLLCHYVQPGMFTDKVMKSVTSVQIKNMPPTSDAAKNHSFWVHYQVRQWMERDSDMEPEEWGWYFQNGNLLPETMESAPAPDSLLKVIRCQCKGDCDTKRDLKLQVTMDDAPTSSHTTSRNMPRTPANKPKSSKKKRNCRHVPYATGFRPPRDREQVEAIGYGQSLPREFNISTDEGSQFFNPVPKPTHIDDWLAQYAEEGQSYQDFVRQCPWLSSRKCKGMSLQKFLPSETSLPRKYPDGKIYLVPIIDTDNAESLYFDDLIDYASRFLCLPVVALPPIRLVVEGESVYWVEQPADKQFEKRKSQRVKRHKLESRYNAKTKHIQICVDSNLLQMRSRIPADALCMVGLTTFDLYGDDTDLFVAGMAAGNQHVGVFSFYRYDPVLSFSTEFWYSITTSTVVPEEERQRLILERSCKLLVHELCHLLGMAHCIYFECCMNGSGHLSEDFRQPMFLCPVDLHKLQTLVDCDIFKRYEELLEFFVKHGMSKEAQWVKMRLKFLAGDEKSGLELSAIQKL